MCRRRLVFLLGILTACAGAPPQETAPRSDVRPPAAPEVLGDPAPPPRPDSRLPAGVHPTRYGLELAIDPNRKSFIGRTLIDVDIEQATRAIVLHGKGMTVKRAALHRAGVAHAVKARSRFAHGSKLEPDELVLELSETIAPGAAQIEIEYEALFAEGLRGAYRVEDGGAAYAFTQFEPNDASRAFPCFDEPGFKTPFEVSISVPVGNIALSNGHEVERRPEPSVGLVTHRFAPTPPLPTYLVAFAVGPFEFLNGPPAPVPLRVVTARGKSSLGKFALDAAQAQLALLSEYFDRPYPYSKLDLVAVPNFAWGAMENAGLVTFREEALLVDPERVSTASERAVAGTIAHELAHQWFGNLVTMQWWDDLWLNEAFASWIGDKTVDQWKPEMAAELATLEGKPWVMGEDSLETARRIRTPVTNTRDLLEAADGMVYVKGPAVLGMVESWLGADRFRSGMRRYVKKHAFGNVTAKDLYSALSAAGNGDVARAVDSFTDQSGVPLVAASLVCGSAGAGSALELVQREYRSLDRRGPSSKLWSIPVCVRFEDRGDLKKQCTLLDAPRARLALDVADPGRCPAFVYLNAEERGYYYSELSPELLGRLKTDASKKLSERERFGIVSNSWASVWAGDAPAARHLELLESFRAEKSRLVMGRIIATLYGADSTVVSDAARASFRKRVKRLLGPTAGRLGWRPKPGEPDEDKLLRAGVLTALGVLAEDPPVLAQAKRLALTWIEKPEGTDADVAGVSVELAARFGDASLFERLVAALKAAQTPDVRLIALRGLGSFTNPALVERALGLILDGTLRSQDAMRLLLPFGNRRKTADVAYAWLTKRFDELAKAVPPPMMGATARLAATFCDAGRVREAEAFFKPRIERLEGAGRTLANAVETGLRCAALAEKERAATEQWLLAH